VSLRELNKRTTVCELCTNEYDLLPFAVVPKEDEILACNTCIDQIESQDLLDMMYMEEETLEWAKATGEHIEEDENTIIHKDSNGTRLSHGDSVVLIKDLDVKGANFTAKRGEFMYVKKSS